MCPNGQELLGKLFYHSNTRKGSFSFTIPKTSYLGIAFRRPFIYKNLTTR